MQSYLAIPTLVAFFKGKDHKFVAMNISYIYIYLCVCIFIYISIIQYLCIYIYVYISGMKTSKAWMIAKWIWNEKDNTTCKKLYPKKPLRGICHGGGWHWWRHATLQRVWCWRLDLDDLVPLVLKFPNAGCSQNSEGGVSMGNKILFVDHDKIQGPCLDRKRCRLGSWVKPL